MKRMIAMAMIAGFVCTAATCDTKSSKVLANCDPLCETKCEPLTGWNGTREEDKLTALFDAHDTELGRCDAHRAACVVCIHAARESAK